MATRRSRPSRTVHVPRTAITSSAKIMDLFAMPIWLFIPYRLMLWCFRHWYVAAIIVTWFLLDRTVSIAILLSVPAVIIGYMWISNPHHSFIAVCRATRHFMQTRMKWKWACEKSEINDGPRAPHLISLIHRTPPKIMNDRGTALEFVINLKRVGMTVEHLETNKDYISSALGARRTRIIRLTPGIARMNIEWDKSQRRGSTQGKTVSDVLLPRVELDQDVFLELETSVLVVGQSGTGKSNLTWFILNELNSIALPYRLYILDPKKVELAELMDSPNIVSYADDITDLDRVIDTFYDEMMRTFERMKPLRLRRAPLGPEWALHLLIIDEILLCDQARKGIDTPLAKVLSAGRAAGFIVIADSQLGQVDALSRLRDLFPQRICMQVSSDELVNAVLGPRCAERGARCTEISEAGIGYIFTDFSGAFMRFKLPFIQGVSRVAQGEVWTPPKKGRRARRKGPCYTYKLYTRTGRLLYVGKGLNPADRIADHKDEPWYGDIDHGRTVIRRYPSEDAALEAEQDDIENLHPIYNLQHNHKRSA